MSQVVVPFYDHNRPATKDVPALANSVLAPGWRSFSGGTCPRAAKSSSQVTGFGRLIPDLTWEIKDVLGDGNRIVVRSQASGTPAGNFMGVPRAGRRSAS